ncbi:MAG: glycosyltransferase [Acidimicrobiia bacterium]|nr:glycosyltransferase [Acidimicrobiia bacterium]
MTTLALVAALAARGDVAEVGVALEHDIPGYARSVLTLPKVRAERVPPVDYLAFAGADVAHRPFQPDAHFDLAAYRKAARRVVVSILDLIAYHVGSYHPSNAAWLGYRRIIRDTSAAVDAVVTISDDVRSIVELERLPIDPERLFSVPYGTEHLSGDEAARIPGELVDRGFAAEEFLLCLGTNYSHKNRDLAVRVHEELRRRGHDLALVLAGPSVPYGSSRTSEALAIGTGAGPVVLPGVATEGRNWLLRHAAVVLYPTSAEGFGLVPYEAARFGTPTVQVGFGPLREVAGHLPVEAADWRPERIADAVESLLRDPDLARRQVEASLAAGAGYSWDDTAEGLVRMYRTVLALPAR